MNPNPDISEQALSLKPQQTKASKGVWWYYENRGSIDVVVDARKVGVMMIRVPSSLLRRTIARQQFMKDKKAGKR